MIVFLLFDRFPDTWASRDKPHTRNRFRRWRPASLPCPCPQCCLGMANVRTAPHTDPVSTVGHHRPSHHVRYRTDCARACGEPCTFIGRIYKSCPGGRYAYVRLAIPTKEIEVDWNIVEGNWKQFKGKVKQQWGKLTDDHLDVIAGKRDELVGKIQESYGITKDEAEKQIEDFEERNKDARP